MKILPFVSVIASLYYVFGVIIANSIFKWDVLPLCLQNTNQQINSKKWMSVVKEFCCPLINYRELFIYAGSCKVAIATLD